MINIFISRPTWVAEEFREGLDGFISFLDTHDLKPRTLGSTDYPTESPLDEVISIMDDCEGAIILGYPQIYIVRGSIKELTKNEFTLPTEWNHIEATLAYKKKLPLLVIHHKGISRGIFEHGAISKFIYEKDLTKINWFLSEDIKGALKKWKSSLKETQKNKTNIPKPVSIPVPKPTPIQPPSEKRFENDVESVLVYLFNQDHYVYRDLPSIKDKFHCNSAAAQYYIDVLIEYEVIVVGGKLNTGNYYSLTPKGREYVMKNKLVSF
jgi:hypothetical protein